MELWNQNQISKDFLHQAEDAERYLSEIRMKVKSNPAYEDLIDDHLARFYVYNYLHGRSFLSSKKGLLSALQKMLRFEVKPRDCYDLEKFESSRKQYINHEITNLEKT